MAILNDKPDEQAEKEHKKKNLEMANIFYIINRYGRYDGIKNDDGIAEHQDRRIFN